MYLYKITNLINNKMYIGITNNYKKRWSNECYNPKDPSKQQMITKKIAQYGKENFKFEVLERNLSIEEAVLKEEKLIKELNTLVPNGYNIDKGGEYHPNCNPQLGEKNGRALLTDEQAQYIKDNRDKPLMILYEEFQDIISYEAFKKCYNGITYKHLTTTTDPYPYNFEFGNQFTNNPLEYDEIVDLRNRYNNGEFWRDVYEEYKEIYTNEWSFWNVYNGRSYCYIMPEVFTKENKKYHASSSKQGNRNGRSKLTIEDIKKIRYLYNIEHKTRKELYALYPQVTTTSIRDIINNKTWKNIN